VALDLQRYKNFELILVDDGSSPSLESIVLSRSVSYPIKFIRIPKSRGQGTARNVGVACAEADSVVFLDDDIRVTDSALCGLALRQQFTRELLIVGFRETVSWDCFAKDWTFTPGIDGDWRHSTEDKGAYLFLTADRNVRVLGKRFYKLIQETDEFRNFGKGIVVGYWDLPHMVVGHSLCAKKAAIIAAGGFEEKCFVGWGTEDLAFGALMIAAGNFVVPALDWVSLHLKHEGRKVSRRRERKEELLINFAEYLRYIDRRVDECRFPAHRIQRTGKVRNVDLFEVVDE
jgi:glycosyltransferase involved in cell wall biosynthesis